MGKTISRLAAITQRVAKCLEDSRPKSSCHRLIDDVAAQLATATQRSSSHREVAQSVSQLLVHARLAWHRADSSLHRAAARTDILPHEATVLGHLLRCATAINPAAASAEPGWAAVANELSAVDSLAGILPPQLASTCRPGESHDYDVWLGQHHRQWRAQFGVYYTPPRVAAHIVHEVDSILRTEFDLSQGLADTVTWHEMAERFPGLRGRDRVSSGAPFVRVLDPALGDGMFLVKVIDRVHQTLHRDWHERGWSPDQQQQAWNDYVERHLLPRLFGLELLLPQAAMAWLRLAEKLAVTGYGFEKPATINIVLVDTLRGPVANGPSDTGNLPFTVVIGNPPFSALSVNTSSWIEDLLRRSEIGGHKVGSYYEVDGQALGEKKLWLHDDYVKFTRYAQWQIEQAGSGIVGFVTNHSFLDNVTFRGMRQSLLASFPQVSVLDLHGNRKKRESSPNGSRDENVFGIDQGIAIAIFTNSPQAQHSRVCHRELWGARDAKLASLESHELAVAMKPIRPSAPYYFLVPSDISAKHRQEYEAGFSLHEVMPIHSSAAVTARDRFVVAFSCQELIERLEALRDPRVGDDEIRDRYFHTRSRRYPSGDTRGWQLGLARKTSRVAGDLSRFIRVCQYRPFDRRQIAWIDWLIDWPRSDVMRHMLALENLALVTRRQMLPGQPCNYFFISDTIVIDGLIRSDNRGNESFFPLYAAPHPSTNGDGTPAKHNFSEPFVARCHKQWSLEWLRVGTGDLRMTIGPADAFAWIYAQFFSQTFRERYAGALRLDFPRVFLPRDRQLLVTMCELGHKLIAHHRCQGTIDDLPEVTTQVVSSARETAICSEGFVVTGRFPLYETGVVHVTHNCSIQGVPRQAWDYQVGVHQVCRKWLRDRRGRILTRQDLDHFRRIVAAISDTIRCTHDIDRAIESAGGWPKAFVGR